jgi:hypothetical protein
MRTGSKFTADYLLINGRCGDGGGYTVAGYLQTQRKCNRDNLDALRRHLEHLRCKGYVSIGKSIQGRTAYYPVEPFADHFPAWIWER